MPRVKSTKIKQVPKINSLATFFWAAALLAAVVLFAVFRDLEYPSPASETPVVEVEGGRLVEVPGLGIHEQCLSLLKGQKLKYSFRSSRALNFNIHFHQHGNPVYLVDLQETSEADTFFTSPRKTEYCLMWINSWDEPAQLSQAFKPLPLDPASLKDLAPVRFVADGEKQAILAIGKSGAEFARINIGSPILNFALSPDGKLLAVVVSRTRQGLRIYSLSTLQPLALYDLPRPARFLSFSTDSRYVATADEHAEEVTISALSGNLPQTINLPAPLIALETGDAQNELLGRTEREVLKMRFHPPELLERNARIELAFGNEKILVDPNEVCFAHGIPHPLYTPKAVAMSAKGLPGFLPDKP